MSKADNRDLEATVASPWQTGWTSEYITTFSVCRKFGASWPKATPAQRAFIEEITRVNYEREMAKRELQP